MSLYRKFSEKLALKSGRLSEVRNTAALFWAERNQRERILLALAGVVVLFGLLYLLLIDPALQGRTQLNKNLPVLRSQAVQLQVLAKQAAALPAAAKLGSAAAGVSKKSIEAALQKNGLKAQSVVWSGDFARLQFTEIPFGVLLDALQALQKTMQLAVVEASVTATAVAGNVNASLSLRVPKAN